MDVRTDFSELRGRILDLNSALESPGPAPSKYIYFPGMKTKLSVSNLGCRRWGGGKLSEFPSHFCLPEYLTCAKKVLSLHIDVLDEIEFGKI